MKNLKIAIDKNKELRMAIADTTKLVQTAHDLHKTSATASAALGRTLTAAALMGAWLKNDNDSLTLSINGDGAAGRIITVANASGNVKGYISNPNADLSPKNNKLDVSGIVGKNGTIEIIYDLGMRENYSGQAMLVSGEIAEDLANYYYRSEQTKTAVALGVLVDVDLNIKSAGGFLIQLLPGATEETISKLEQILAKLDSISNLILNENSLEDIINKYFSALEMEIIESKEFIYQCNCNKERIENVLISLGKDEIESMIAEDEGAEVICHFCNKNYKFDKSDLTNLLQLQK